MARLLWLIDDSPGWHEVTAATLSDFPDWQFESFLSGNAALLALSERLDAGDPALPVVVLMDFYLGSMRGDAVTEAWREIERNGYRATIVGHSTAKHGSELICMAGADCIVSKHADGRGVNPSLTDWLKEFDELV